MRKVLHQEAVEITFTIPDIAGKKYVICFLISVLPGGGGGGYQQVLLQIVIEH